MLGDFANQFSVLPFHFLVGGVFPLQSEKVEGRAGGMAVNTGNAVNVVVANVANVANVAIIVICIVSAVIKEIITTWLESSRHGLYLQEERYVFSPTDRRHWNWVDNV